MNYKKFTMDNRPAGKQNCICWLTTNAFYDKQRKCFVGLNGELENKILINVTDWAALENPENRFDVNEVLPNDKQKCICWFKVASWHHQKKQIFFGRYGDLKNKPLHDVVEWAYAILPKRHSSDLFPEMVTQLQMANGTEVFRTQYSCLDTEKQERLFNEVQLIEAAILNWLNKYG